MKKIRIITMLLIIITTLLIAPKISLTTNRIILGDINGDQKIDQTDLVLMLRHISATTNKKHEEWILKDEKFKAADITENNTIDTSDVLGIMRYIAASNSTELAKKYPEWLKLKEKELDPTPDPTPTPTPTPKPEPTVIDVKSIILDKTNIELDISGTKTTTIKAEVEPSNATDKTITYISSNEKIAKVDSNGKITAVANGTVTITVRTNNGKTATCEVTVKTTATNINITKTSDTLKEENTSQISVLAGPAGAEIKDIELSNSDQEKLAVEKVIENGTYYIKSGLNEKKVLDVANGSKENKATIQIYDRNETEAQKFEITNISGEYYTIKSKKSGKAIDVTNGGYELGTKIQQYTSNGTDAQQWEFEYLGNGYYQIKSKLNGLYLDVKGGKTSNKTPLQVWKENKSKAQRFKLEQIDKKTPLVEDGTYYIKTTLDEKKVLDVANGSMENKAAIQIYDRNETEAQRFEITGIGNNYYVIRSAKSGKAIDVVNGGTKAGTKIQQYSYNGTNAQIWKIEKGGDYYRFKSKSSGLYLDVTGAKANNKVQLQIYTGNKDKAQRFKLEQESKTIKHENIEYILLKGKKELTATITSKLANGKVAKCKVTIKPNVKNVLFIGNSKTYYNNLSKIFTGLSNSAGRKVNVQEAANGHGGKSLNKIIEYDDVKKAIKSKKWDYIILQEQTKASIADNNKTKNGAKKIIKYAKENSNKNVNIIYDATWVYKDLKTGDINKTNKKINDICKTYGGKVVYTGSKFLQCKKNNPKIELFVDNIHPTPVGSYLRACCDYVAVFGKSPEGIKYYTVYDQKDSGKKKSISSATASIMQKIAASALKSN